jgi:hypothetical protein
MSTPENAAATAAIVELEHGQTDAALKLLRGVMSQGGPPKSGTDERPADLVRLRSYIEQAIVELEAQRADLRATDTDEWAEREGDRSSFAVEFVALPVEPVGKLIDRAGKIELLIR